LSLNQIKGSNSKIYEEMREKLIRMLAHAEAYIDFADDETNDIRPEVFVEIGKDTILLEQDILKYLQEA
jgi:tRNA U34 5-carboxymethylaminomethyl modifying GTPase MnmE/TrmE